MKKNTILQFVGFITTLDAETFAGKWEFYTRQPGISKQHRLIEEAGTKTRFKYISRHELTTQGFRFDFLKNRHPEQLPENNVKVTQTGGYICLQSEWDAPAANDDVKIIAFLGPQENDTSFCKELPAYHHLNIYQAYYESCIYSYILEFFVPEAEAANLLQQLKSRTGIEAAVYRESMVAHA